MWGTLRRDPVMRFAVPVLLLSLLPYVLPLFGEEAQHLYADAYADLPLLILIIGAFQVGLRKVVDDRERRFWNLWSVAFGFWVAIRLLFVVAPVAVQVDHRFDVVIDLLYCCFYLSLVVAVDLEPGSGYVPPDSVAAATTSGTAVAAAALLGYFAVIPSAINPDNYSTWVPSLILYTVLDVYLFYRLSRAWRQTTDERWRRIYGWLTIAVGLWCLTDGVEALAWGGVIPWFWPGTLFDLPWYLPLIAVAIAARVRTHGIGATPSAVPRESATGTNVTRLWGGSFAMYAFGLALVHVAVEAIGLMDAETRPARNVWVLSMLALLLVLAIRRERVLARSAGETAARARDLQRQLRQVRKMESLGRLAGGVAHDFNNILAAIIGYSELAKQQTPKGEETHDHLDSVLRAADRATHLVRRITTFSRHGGHDSQPVEIVPVVRESLELLRATLPATTEIVEEIDDTVGYILGDSDHLYQAMLNLGANAADAMGEGGIMKVRVEPIATAEDLPRPMAVSEPGPYVLLTVSDTGCGMDSELAEHIFEPFFTTKDRGVGLGLSAVHAIATRHGGIRVDSEPGKGTTFRLCFVSTPERSGLVPKEGSARDLRGTERILVVDDEPSLVRLAQQQLGRLGYVVTSETDPEQALDRFTNLPEGFDFLVTDQTMPGRSGLQLARAIKNVRPDLPILLTTGYSEVVTPQSSRAAGVDVVIAKPFDERAIAGAIRELVDARGAAS